MNRRGIKGETNRHRSQPNEKLSIEKYFKFLTPYVHVKYSSPLVNNHPPFFPHPLSICDAYVTDKAQGIGNFLISNANHNEIILIAVSNGSTWLTSSSQLKAYREEEATVYRTSFFHPCFLSSFNSPLHPYSPPTPGLFPRFVFMVEETLWWDIRRLPITLK